MYLKYWNLQKKPFSQQFVLDEPFMGDSYASCRLKLEYLIEDHKSLGILLGDVGVGKSYLLQSLMHERRHEVIAMSLMTPPESRADLYLGIAHEIEYPLHEFTKCTLDQQQQVIIQRLFEWTQEGQPVVILIDDAHLYANREVLLGLHLLLKNFSDTSLNVHFILAGHYALRESLKLVPELEDRVDVVAQLRCLGLAEVGAYIDHRLRNAGCKQQIFSEESVDYIFQVSQGSPRRINRLCDLALLVGCAEGCNILTPDLIAEVIEDVIHKRAA
jgi:general secretion pathway protein A